MTNKREGFVPIKPPIGNPESSSDYFDWRKGKVVECLSGELREQTEEEKQAWKKVYERVVTGEKEYAGKGTDQFRRTMAWLNDEQLGYVLATAAKIDIELSLKYGRLDAGRPYKVLSKKERGWKTKLDQVVTTISDKILKGEKITTTDLDSTTYPNYPYNRFSKIRCTKERKDEILVGDILDGMLGHRTYGYGEKGNGLLGYVPYIFSIPKSQIARILRSMFEDLYKEQLTREKEEKLSPRTVV